MSDSIKIEMDCSSPEQTEVTANSVEDLIPPKSRKVYDFTYRRFLKWAEQQKASHYSENVLLTYFNHLSNNEHLKSSTLWSHYSMLKAELNINHNIRLGKYTKLLAFLKRKNAGYKPKKTKILSKQQVDNFLHNAPNEKYLATKVILILGVTGGCRCDEITSLTMGDIEDLGSAILIKLQDTRNYKSRSFIIVEKFYLEICRKYISVRKDIKISRFLLKYHNGKCANMVMGKHKIGSAPREIASFLKLPNYHEYTGHCLRRTSATLLVDNGDISALERHKGWRSMPVTESCRKDSIENREQTVLKVLTPLDINKPSTSNNLNSVVDITIKIESDSDDTDKRELGTTSAVKIENFGEYKLGPLIVEGKTKQVYELPGSPDLCILLNTDRITAGDGVKAHDLAGKAALSNKTNRKVFEILNAVGVKTSFVKPATDVAFVSKRCKMIPIEWVTRRLATGSFVRRHPGVPEGYRFYPPKHETFFKDGANQNSQWSTEQIISAKFKVNGLEIGPTEVDIMTRTSILVFEVLEKVWATRNCALIDMKIEFGVDTTGEILVADVIDSDSWRLWPSGDKRLMVDKQMYRNLTTVTASDLDTVKRNFEWVVDQLDHVIPPNDHLIVILMGSPSDKEQCKNIEKYCQQLGLNTELRVTSAHKGTEETIKIVRYYESLSVKVVFIAVAGRSSNGLGPVISGNSPLPVINCPPLKADNVDKDDVWSCLNVPSGLGCSTVVYPEAAALNAANIVGLSNYIVWSKLRVKQLDSYVGLAKADKGIRT